jgi:hypothetical protein
VRRASTSSPSSIHTSVRSRIGSSLCFLRGAITGSTSVFPSRFATQWVARGQIRQRGEVGEHSVAPSSIKPWLRSPGAELSGSAAISSPAAFHSALLPAVDLMSTAIPRTRDSTRATLPSTSGARSPRAIDAIAPAVYGPMPLISSSSLARAGSLPANRASISFAPVCSDRARA